MFSGDTVAGLPVGVDAASDASVRHHRAVVLDQLAGRGGGFAGDPAPLVPP